MISFLHSHMSLTRGIYWIPTQQRRGKKLIVYQFNASDVKIYGRGKGENDSLVQTARTFSNDVGVDFGINKWLCSWWSKSGKRTADYRENLLTFQIFNYSCSSTAATKWNTAAIKILLGFWAEEIFAMEFIESWIYSLLQQSTGKVLTSITCFQQLHPMWAWVIFTSFVSFWFCG